MKINLDPKQGDKYQDVPRYIWHKPRADLVSPIAEAVRDMVKAPPLLPAQELDGYDRHPLACGKVKGGAFVLQLDSYELVAQCIRSGQASDEQVQKHMADKVFAKWYDKHYGDLK